jgi:hypothetical protein
LERSVGGAACSAGLSFDHFGRIRGNA